MSRKDLQTGRALFVKKWSENLFLWALGGSLYYGFEVFFRGFSHWSMFVLGGICLLFCAKQGLWTGWREPLWKQVLWCTIFVTAAEFITGMIVNQWLWWEGLGFKRKSFSPWMECMGLYRKKMAAVRSDLSAVYHYFFRTVRDRHSALRVSSLLVIRGRKTTFSRALGSRKADKIGSGTLN